MALEALRCPVCEGPMVSRLNRRTGQRFWGCRAYPNCKGTRNTDGEASHSRSREEANEAAEEQEATKDLPSNLWRERDRRRWR